MTTTALAPRQTELLLANPLGCLDHYIQAANSIPVLTVEEERDLATRFREANDSWSTSRAGIEAMAYSSAT
jgi:hypothetical protein